MIGDDRQGAKEPRHPLPASDEARGGELPENLVSEKGTGDDSVEAIQPADAPVGPDGEPYGEPTGRSAIERTDED